MLNSLADIRTRTAVGLGWALCLCTGLHAAPASLHGIIEKDTEWKVENSPYLITGDLLVKSGAVLRIEAGAKILLAGGESQVRTPGIPQLDESDSLLISIKIQGGLICEGENDNWIVFASQRTPGRSPADWYGLILDGVSEEYAQIGFCDISGAAYGVRIRKCRPDLRNLIVAYNTTGFFCDQGAAPIIHNSTIAHNTMAGIYIRGANPRIVGNVIAFNRNHGIWSDGLSQIEVGYNCLYGNQDGNFMDCLPQLGRIVRCNAKGDSCDKSFNIFRDPVFVGSVSDSVAESRDPARPTPASLVKDTAIAQMTKRDRLHNETAKAERAKAGKYVLSAYSPCIDAGQVGKKFNDLDGSPNDMGAYGGPGTKME